MRFNYDENSPPNSNEALCIDLDDGLGAEQALDASMQLVHDLLIVPMVEEDRLSLEQTHALTVVASVLGTIARKAAAYEHMFERGNLPENSQN